MIFGECIYVLNRYEAQNETNTNLEEKTENCLFINAFVDIHTWAVFLHVIE